MKARAPPLSLALVTLKNFFLAPPALPDSLGRGGRKAVLGEQDSVPSFQPERDASTAGLFDKGRALTADAFQPLWGMR